MNIYSVYKATNKINNKVYIGIDKNWPTRQYAHKSKSKLYDGFSLHKAIRKYGWINFDWQVIYQTSDYNHLKEVESICDDDIVCWGSFKQAGERIKDVLPNYPNAKCFCVNNNKTPYHPLAMMYNGKSKNPQLFLYSELTM